MCSFVPAGQPQERGNEHQRGWLPLGGARSKSFKSRGDGEPARGGERAVGRGVRASHPLADQAPDCSAGGTDTAFNGKISV